MTDAPIRVEVVCHISHNLVLPGLRPSVCVQCGQPYSGPPGTAEREAPPGSRTEAMMELAEACVVESAALDKWANGGDDFAYNEWWAALDARKAALAAVRERTP